MNVLFATVWLIFALTSTALADVPASQKEEVDYLLNTLETSDCMMVRNGKSHSGAEGARHARRKYNHFRSDINSTEEFIEYSATKSTVSGKPYWIECPDQEPVKSKDWLLSLLERYRADQKQ